MFRKLISNLPFNPSLIGEVAFYYKRLQHEEQIRRFGVILVVLSFLIQGFAVLSPAEPSLASSPYNDILNGGFTTHSQAVAHCQNNSQNFATILAYYGVSCSTLANARTRMINSTDYNYLLDSMGRQSKGTVVARTGKATNEYPVSIAGTTYYMRNLWAFDSRASSPYKVLEMKNNKGDTIFVMYDCGNIVTIHEYKPTPPAPKPAPPPPSTPKKVDACPNKPKFQSSKSECDVCPKIKDIQYKYSECDVCPKIPGEQSRQSECYPCPEAEEDSSNKACLEMDKSATNITQDIANANGTQAKAGDVIAYTLSVKNTGVLDVPDFVIEEDLADVLEYSTLTDAGGGNLDDDTKIISWPAETIKAKQTVTKTISVKVKDPIPSTPTSSSDITSFDLIMSNTFYGETVNIELPKSVVKTTETVTQTLPKTGPGESMLAITAVTVFVSYFLARAHLLRKETQLVRTQFLTEGN